MLKTLKLKDFCQHQDLTVDIRPGLTVICGANGTGKSTILSALRFAISGESFGSGKKESDIRHGAKKARVTLEFSHQDIDYTVVREIGTGAKTTLRGGGQDLTSVKEVNLFLEKLFSINRAVIRDNVFAKQKSIDELLDKLESDRLKDLQGVFGLQQVQAAHRTLGADLSQYHLTAGLSDQQQAAALALTETRASLRAAEVTRDAAARDIQALRGPAEATLQRALRCREAELRNQAAFQALERCQAALTAANQERTDEALRRAQYGDIPTLEGRLSLLRASLAREQQAAVQAATRTSLQRQIEAITAKELQEPELSREAVDEAIRTERALKEELTALEVEIASVDRRQDLVVLQDRIEAAKRDRDLLGTKPQQTPALQELAQRARDLQRTLDGLKAGICGECGRPLDGQHGDDHQANLASTQATLNEVLAETRRVATQVLLDFQAAVKRAGDLVVAAEMARGNARRQIIDDLQLKRLAIQPDLQAAIAASTDLSDRFRQQEMSRRAVQGLRDQLAELPVSLATPGALEDLQRQVETTELALQGARSAEQALQVAEVRFKAAERARQDAQDAYEASTGGEAPPAPEEVEAAKQAMQKVLALTQTHQDALALVGQLTGQAASGSREVSRLTQQLEVEARDQAWVAIVEAAQAALHPTEFPLQVMRSYVEIVNDRLAHHLGVLDAPFRFWLDAEEMQFIAEFPDGRRHIGARLSGAQRTIAAISFRLALSDTFASQLGFVTLDEPTADMDANNVENFQRLLLALKRDTAETHRQIIIITHEQSLMAFADHAIQL